TGGRHARAIRTAARDRPKVSRRSVTPMSCCASREAVRRTTARTRSSGRALSMCGEVRCATRRRARSISSWAGRLRQGPRSASSSGSCAPTGEREPRLERDFPMPTSVLGNRATDWRCGMANLLIRDPFLAAPFRLMDELMRSTGNGNRVTGFTPLVDVHETEEEYLVKIDLPGVKPDDVNVEVNENVL